MLIGIMSDSHNNVNAIKNAISYLDENKIGIVIHCGDVTRPKILKIFEINRIHVHLSFGNMDAKDNIRKSFKDSPYIELEGDFGELNIDKRTIYFSHYPDIAHDMARSNGFDIVFYGHTHKFQIDKIGNTIIANPGEIAGIRGHKTFIIYDAAKNKIEKVHL